MKHLIFILLLFSITSFGQRIEKKIIKSKFLNQDREVLVYTPWEYENMPEKRFEVIFVFDSQNRIFFDNVYSTYQFVNNYLFPTITVGVSSPYDEKTNYSRRNDFLPLTINELDKKKENGNAENFLLFIEKELIPFLNNEYRTLPKRIAVGHSLGATFLSYTLINKPNVFDGYIMISPNLAWNNEYFVNEYNEFNTDQMNEKFVFMSNANEIMEGWKEASRKVNNILNKKDNIFFIHQDFSKEENHLTSFPVGTFNGLKEYFNYQFLTIERLNDYYTYLNENELIELSPEKLNQLAYDILAYNPKYINKSINILKWAINIFPDNLNLYDSMGEMYQKKDDNVNAMKYYKLFETKLNNQKEKLDENIYLKLKKDIKGRIEYIKNK